MKKYPYHKYLYQCETKKYYEVFGTAWLSSPIKYIEVNELTYLIGKHFKVAPDQVIELLIRAIGNITTDLIKAVQSVNTVNVYNRTDDMTDSYYCTCHKTISINDNFCPNCGKKIIKTKEVE